MMEIESYEPFHVGSKFRYYVDNLILAKLYEYYEKNKKKDFELNSDILSGDKYISPILNIITNKKEKLTIQLNLSANALNFVGNEPEMVIELFNDLLDNLPELGFELKSTFSFYEIITNVIVKLEEQDKKPSEIFEKFSSNTLTGLNHIPDLGINYIRFSNKLVQMDDDERFNLEVSPNRTSPDKRIILKILNRSNDYNKIIEFQKNLEGTIKEIFNKLVE